MGFNFEKFVESAVTKVSIRKSGAFGFLGGAAKKFNLLDGERAVICHYDRTAKAIGLQFTDNLDEEGAIKISKIVTKDHNGAERSNIYFNGKVFLDFYEIPHGTTRAFIPIWDEQHQMAVLDLKQGSEDKQENDVEAEDG